MSSNWEQKLFHYKADPPPSAWDAIAAGLDAQKESFPEKLYNYSEQPPAGAWQNIEAQLPAAESGKVVPLRTKWLRYAAAAVVLLAIAGMAYFSTLTNNQSATAGNTANTPLLNTTPAAPPSKKEITTHYNLPPQPAEVATTETATKEKSNHATYTMTAASMVNRVPRKQQQASLPIEPAFAGGLDVVPQQKNIIDTDRADRYMIATPEDGDPVRLPKKVYSAFACPEDDPRHQACELRLTQLQQKMSASLTTDFAHFLDLLMNLQEN